MDKWQKNHNKSQKCLSIFSLNAGESDQNNSEYGHFSPSGNEDNLCFKYAATVALNHENIGKHLERITRITPFINQYNWTEIDFLTKSKNWNKFEISNETIVINVFFSPRNRKEIKQMYISKHNSERENQIIHFMITDSEKWH